MSYYGGTVTVGGRNLITSLMAGETIEFTRIIVGSGAMPEGVEPIDMTALVNPIAEGVSTVPTVDNSVLSLVVEYRNDLNGGLETGFWLREFGIFAKTAKTDEILLYYATLGDSPQPVNAYKDNRIDIRRYPVTIALEIDADVQVTYNPGAFITSAEAQQLLQGLVSQALDTAAQAFITPIVIPSEGWVLDDSEQDYPYSIDIVVEQATESCFPSVALDRLSLKSAEEAGVCPTVSASYGSMRFWSEKIPDSDLTGTLMLTAAGANFGSSDGTYVLPAATDATLGGVRVKNGSGLKVDTKGNLSLDTATDEEILSMFDSGA